MAYQRTEYSRERDSDREDSKQGGWKSWFGLDDSKKDREEGYNYSSTATYRNPQYGYPGERSGYSGPISGGYSGPRGGYGYTTTDEVSRGPNYPTDREYYGQTRGGYGTTSDVYYKPETRTYGGEWTTGRPYSTPSRSYGFERDYPTRGYSTEYPSTRPTTCEYPSTRGYPMTGEYTSRHPTYPTAENTTSRYPTGEFSSRYPTYPTGEFSSRHPTGEFSSRFPVTGERYPTGYGYERDYTRSSYPSTYPSTYRY